MPDSIHFDFGDGAKADGHSGAASHHDFNGPGTYTISATDDEGHSGTTTFTVPTKTGQPKATLSISDLAMTQGEDDEAQDSTLINSGGPSDDCTGQLTITDGAVLDGKIGMKMLQFTPGQDIDVTFTVNGDDLVGTYPDTGGFPLLGPQHGTGVNHWSCADDATPGEYDVVSETLSSGGDQLAEADWTLTIAAKS